jgi:hypothetical protein
VNELVKITGLWLNVDKDGAEYLNGYLGNAKLLIFKNTYKEKGSKQPDYNLYVTKKEEAPTALPKIESEPKNEAPISDFDIPF